RPSRGRTGGTPPHWPARGRRPAYRRGEACVTYITGSDPVWGRRRRGAPKPRLLRAREDLWVDRARCTDPGHVVPALLGHEARVLVEGADAVEEPVLRVDAVHVVGA